MGLTHLNRTDPFPGIAGSFYEGNHFPHIIHPIGTFLPSIPMLNHYKLNGLFDKLMVNCFNMNF